MILSAILTDPQILLVGVPTYLEQIPYLPEPSFPFDAFKGLGATRGKKCSLPITHRPATGFLEDFGAEVCTKTGQNRRDSGFPVLTRGGTFLARGSGDFRSAPIASLVVARERSDAPDRCPTPHRAKSMKSGRLSALITPLRIR